MDSIFHKCHSWFTVVKIAQNEPRRFGRKGELLINYEETEEHVARQQSVVSATKKSQESQVETAKGVELG